MSWGVKKTIWTGKMQGPFQMQMGTNADAKCRGATEEGSKGERLVFELKGDSLHLNVEGGQNQMEHPGV